VNNVPELNEKLNQTALMHASFNQLQRKNGMFVPGGNLSETGPLATAGNPLTNM